MRSQPATQAPKHIIIPPGLKVHPAGRQRGSTCAPELGLLPVFLTPPPSAGFSRAWHTSDGSSL
eukprot:366412-Chlamydomonas_euryale.AAC.8